MSTTPPRKPQDRKPKATKPGVGEFEHEGQKYTLPPPSEALGNLPGRALRDALLGGQEGELRLAFLALEATGAAAEAVDALYSKPVPEMMGILGPWLQSAAVGGATLPESPSSSD